MNLDIKFRDVEMAKEFADMLREANERGVQVKPAYKKAEKDSLASPELMEVVTLVINSGVLTGAGAMVLRAVKTFYDYKIKKIELQMQENENKLALDTKKNEFASKVEIEKIKAETARQKIEAQTLANEKEHNTRIIEAELKEDIERFKALANKK